MRTTTRLLRVAGFLVGIVVAVMYLFSQSTFHQQDDRGYTETLSSQQEIQAALVALAIVVAFTVVPAAIVMRIVRSRTKKRVGEAGREP